ncbi:MAG: glutathione S-transferase N-terminal domain-containing protein [Salinisphaera sp.]|jgi:glutathione S-transferase|nr:glutathione S-transferase N-terminal domain-containing protein [Salinisphaera sp.]
MELLGSAASPFVRRIRLLLGERDCVFRGIDIYGADREALRQANPTMKIPVLIDDDQTVLDSRVIARYLSAQMDLAPLSWAQENQLTVIDGATDSAFLLLSASRSGIDIGQDMPFIQRQQERIAACVASMDAQAEQGAFQEWNYPAICAYASLDWMLFRELFDFASFPGLLALRERHQHQPMVAETDPRQPAD